MKGRRIFGVLWGLWCAGTALFAAAQEPPADEAQQAADRSGTIETVTVVGARPMADIGIQKTVFDEELLRETLAELYDPAVPFRQCDDPDTCRFCDFNVICKR